MSKLIQLLTVLAAALPLCGESLTVGNANSTQVYPFTGNLYNTPSRYQQIYSSSAFPGPIDIESFSFMHDPQSGYPIGNVIDDATYTISFSTTSVAVNQLTTNFNANVGSVQQLFAISTLTALSNPPNPLVFTASMPYVYDPSQGNLLLDIVVTNGHFPGSSRSLGYAFRADDSGTLMSRALYMPGAFYPGFLQDQSGLVTDFGIASSTASTPEPSYSVFVFVALGVIAVKFVVVGQFSRSSLAYTEARP